MEVIRNDQMILGEAYDVFEVVRDYVISLVSGNESDDSESDLYTALDYIGILIRLNGANGDDVARITWDYDERPALAILKEVK